MPQIMRGSFQIIVGEGADGILHAAFLVPSPSQDADTPNLDFMSIPLTGDHLTELMTRIAEARSREEAQKAHPASKKMIDDLPLHEITSEFFPKQQCTVCLEDWEKDQLALEMPCGHFYHKDCIFPWLERANTCPSCRYPLFTEDEEFNKTVQKDLSSRAPTQNTCNCIMKPIGLCEVEGTDSTVSLSCGHFFHEPCFNTSMVSTGQEVSQSEFRCPYCRANSRVESPL